MEILPKKLECKKQILLIFEWIDKGSLFPGPVK